MDVIATARDGVDGLEKALALRPDVITLDVQMPRMDGLEMLKQLMARQPTPVIMVSSITQHQTPAAVEALMLGAVDVVAKPGGPISLNLADVRDELVAKVRAAAGARLERRPPRRVRERPGVYGIGERPSRTGKTPGAAHVRPGVDAAAGAVAGALAGAGAVGAAASPAAGGPGTAPVVIGSSTGGPSALSTVLAGLPADFPRPVVIVQHMPPGFTASLARRLDRLSPLKVDEAVEQRRPQPGEAWIAPGGVHLVFDELGRMCYSHAAPHLGMRPAVDLTLESAVDVWGGDVIAVILTGMGVDGARGARKLKKAGGTVLAQDEATSVVYGMPRAVAEMGLADAVKPLPEIAQALAALVGARC